MSAPGLASAVLSVWRLSLGPWGTTTVLLQRFWRVPDLGRSGVEHRMLVGAWFRRDVLSVLGLSLAA